MNPFEEAFDGFFVAFAFEQSKHYTTEAKLSYAIGYRDSFEQRIIAGEFSVRPEVEEAAKGFLAKIDNNIKILQERI